jgi:hypothetical protein
LRHWAAVQEVGTGHQAQGEASGGERQIRAAGLAGDGVVPSGSGCCYASRFYTKKGERESSPWARDGCSAAKTCPRRSPAVRRGRRSWGRASGCAAGLLAPRSAAHAGGEGRAGVRGAEDAPARMNCGGAGAEQRRRLTQIRAVEWRCRGSGCAGGVAAA